LAFGFVKTIIASPDALRAVEKAQSQLPCNIQLVIKRGYEAETMRLRILRRIGRWLFVVLFWTRRDEAAAIFYHNGHADNGDHVDIGVVVNGVLLRFLPFNVFTPMFCVKRIEIKYADVLTQVCAALNVAGFVIHPNRIEALQIHCDWNRT
jgi:hypothetical protein